MLWTDESLHLSFGIVTVCGVITGSLAYALASGSLVAVVGIAAGAVATMKFRPWREG